MLGTSWLVLLVAIVGVSCLVWLQVEAFDKSAYKAETGKSWWKTVSDKGSNGEYELGRVLEKAFPDCKLLFNVYVPKSNGETSEIDVLMITGHGIYVFESKNYSGWIFGDENDRNWTATLNSNTKNRFYNPIKQNATHVKWLCRYLGVDQNIVRSVVVFSDRCELKKLTLTGDVPVVQRRRVVPAVRSLELASTTVLREAEQQAIYDRLRGRCNLSEAARRKHVEDIKRRVG